ncbi:uncharacterized protein V6R79_002461 [Siganus canaliculatus]
MNIQGSSLEERKDVQGQSGSTERQRHSLKRQTLKVTVKLAAVSAVESRGRLQQRRGAAAARCSGEMQQQGAAALWCSSEVQQRGAAVRCSVVQQRCGAAALCAAALWCSSEVQQQAELQGVLERWLKLLLVVWLTAGDFKLPLSEARAALQLTEDAAVQASEWVQSPDRTDKCQASFFSTSRSLPDTCSAGNSSRYKSKAASLGLCLEEKKRRRDEEEKRREEEMKRRREEKRREEKRRGDEEKKRREEEKRRKEEMKRRREEEMKRRKEEKKRREEKKR